MDYEIEIDTIIKLSELDYVWPDPEEEIMQKQLGQAVQDLLDTLTPRESKVLKLRFGIGVPQEYTLDDVGFIFQVTRERIRQIEAKALRKLRQPVRADKLREVTEITPCYLLGSKNLYSVAPEDRAQSKFKTSLEIYKQKKEPKKPREIKKIEEKPQYSYHHFDKRPARDAEGWIDGYRFTPIPIGVYQRHANNYTAYSFWNGTNWLVGADTKEGALLIEGHRISDYQLIKWREIKEE